jgi:anion-transporting  ArsA/GET3 family ATPase
VAARDDVSRALGGTGAHEDELAEGLHHISIDPEDALEEYLSDQLRGRMLADLLTSSSVFAYLAAATPGLRELLTVGKVWELAQEDRRKPGAHPYDLVVLDAPATGHGVGILTAPRTFAEVARLGRIARQGRTIDEMLSDPARTGVIAVARPEEMPVNETLALERALPSGTGLNVDLVVANGVLPSRFSAAEARELEESRNGRAVGTALAAHRRARTQQAQLARLRRGSEAGVVTLPFLFEPVLEGPALEALSRHLERVL